MKFKIRCLMNMRKKLRVSKRTVKIFFASPSSVSLKISLLPLRILLAALEPKEV